MFRKRDKFEMLATTPEEILKEMFPDGDPGSPIPVDYQNIGDYTLNEKGIHCFEIDKNGQMDIVTIYPIPFIVKLKKNSNLLIEFFLPEHQVVEIESTLEKYIQDTFHSLPEEARNRIRRFCSYSILKLWGDDLPNA